MLGKAIFLLVGIMLVIIMGVLSFRPIDLVRVHAQYPTATNTPTPNPTPYEIYGYYYREQNSFVDRSTAPAEGLIGGRTVRLSGDATDSTTSSADPTPTPPSNYQFTSVYGGVYSVAITPPAALVTFLQGGYTNPQIAVVAGAPVIVDFPLVTVTPTFAPGTPTPTPPGGGFPTNTPTPTVPVSTPTTEPTPTSSISNPTITPGGSGVPPGSTITPGGPEPPPPGSTITPGGPGVPPGSTVTPGSCALPTPSLQNPAHELCTNQRPLFQADVSDPKGDSVWAHFYSNSHETFSEPGSVQDGTSLSTSEWQPQSHHLTTSSGYWWSAYTETPSCTRSENAPARLLYMDYTPPPQPNSPTCTFVEQNYISGETTFSCRWDPVISSDGTCGIVNNYHPIFWTQPGGGSWDPGWIGNVTNITVVTADGQELFAQVIARDSAGNSSDASEIGGPFVAPLINYSFSPTPGPSATAAPTITLTPTPFATATPGPWIKMRGGDVFQESVNQPIPTGEYFLDSLPTPTVNPNSIGVVWSTTGVGSYGSGNASPTNWQVSGTFKNPYQFSFYWNQLKDKAVSVYNAQVGRPEDLTSTDSIYLYSQGGFYTLSSFIAETPHTIFMVSGSLEITQNFSISGSETVTFIVNGNVFIGPDVTTIPGLFIVSQTFTVADTTPPGSAPLTVDGMVYTDTLNLVRSFASFTDPALLIIYQPKYIIHLLPFLGRSQVNWKELSP